MKNCFFWPSVMEQQATHYAELSKKPGWIDYCRRQVREMEADPSGVWVGILAMVKNKLSGDKT
jgi:hypothetical protein